MILARMAFKGLSSFVLFSVFFAAGVEAQPVARPRRIGGPAANEPSSSSSKQLIYLVEPFVGYGFGSLTQGTNAVTLSGLGFGGRVGVVWKYFMIAAEGGYAIVQNSLTNISSNDMAIGLSVGGTLPSIPLRVFGTFNFTDKLTASGSATRLDSDSWKLGLTYFLSDWLAINGEYNFRTYAKVQGQELSYNNAFVSLSLPFAIGADSLPAHSKAVQSQTPSDSESPRRVRLR